MKLMKLIKQNKTEPKARLSNELMIIESKTLY